jgi:hypothetical protein
MELLEQRNRDHNKGRGRRLNLTDQLMADFAVVGDLVQAGERTAIMKDDRGQKGSVDSTVITQYPV